MILITAALLIALGVSLYVIGFAFNRPEMAMFGAVIIIGVGATGMVYGIQVASGIETSVETTDSSVPDPTFASPEYIGELDVAKSTQDPTNLEATNGRMLISGNTSVTKYDVGSDLTTGTETGVLNVSNELNASSDAVERDNTVFVVSDTDNQLAWYNVSSGYSTATHQGTINVVADSIDVEIKPDGTEMAILSGSNSEITTYTLTTAYDPSSASLTGQKDVSASAPVESMTFEQDGIDVLVLDSNGEAERLRGAEPYDADSLTYSGDVFSATSGTTEPVGIAYLEDGATVSVADRTDEVVRSYDVSVAGSRTESTEQTQYEPVEIHTGFPLDVVILLLGAVMLMGSSGLASETEAKPRPWE